MPRRYDSWFWIGFCQVPLWDRAVIAALGPGIRSDAILDVGCATGRLLAKLADAGATRLCGVDLAPNILGVAAEKLAPRLVAPELRAADAEDSIPWPEHSFDVVTLTGVLHHFYRPDDALREIHRVLRPGGRLLVMDPELFPPLRQVLNLVLLLAPHAGDYHFYSRRAAAKLLERAGFRCLEARRVGLWAYLLTAVRPDAPTGPARQGAAPGRPSWRQVSRVVGDRSRKGAAGRRRRPGADGSGFSPVA
ncbi:MAG: hypothetical protein AMJ81_13455 [Phycisphaerae bacterium SM23_33]|nr:MAG: hypothetical protein AMJ81_13455 [Phycisphaerae bacterium SM23_33]